MHHTGTVFHFMYHLQGVKFIPDNQFNFLWIVDFPLFLPAESGGMCTNSVCDLCFIVHVYDLCMHGLYAQ